MTITIEDNGKNGRIIIKEDTTLAGEMTFIWSDENLITIDHTTVDKNFGGRGIGKKLFSKAIEHARENNLKIIPVCPFVVAQFERNPETKDVLHS